MELRVSLAVGAAFFAQSALAFMWAGAAAERIDQLERRVEAREELMVRTARLEEQVSAIRVSLIRIEQKLDHRARGEE